MKKEKKESVTKIGIKSVYVFYPLNFDDVQYSIDSLVDGTPLIVSFSKVDEKNTQRFLDFLSGAIYAVEGNVLQLNQRDFLFCPNGVEVVFDN